LPHPDLDIDLDPKNLGGEPLFADQWVNLVTRAAEAATASLSLAMDQEEETEQFLRLSRLQEQENYPQGEDIERLMRPIISA
ncbi:hypothetical protein BGZ65_010311, partial [Modicella reniformis]